MPNTRRRLTGTVVSDNMQKTIMVSVSRTKRHKLYGKVIRTNKKYMVHDEHEEAELGDVVQIIESRPRSKRKRWALETIVRKQRVPTLEQVAAEVAEEEPEEGAAT